MADLNTGLINEISRVEDLLREYTSIPTGVFAAALLRDDLRIAKEALASGDVVNMIAAYKRLQECE